MSEKMTTRRLLIMLAVILGIILVVAIIVGVVSSRQSVQSVRPGKLNDYGWELITPIVDEGGVGGLSYENGRGYLLVGRGEMADGSDYRDASVKFEDKRESGERVMRIYIDSQNQSDGERGYIPPDVFNRPVAVYQFKLRDADRIELYIDGQVEEFTVIHSDSEDILR